MVIGCLFVMVVLHDLVGLVLDGFPLWVILTLYSMMLVIVRYAEFDEKMMV